MLDHELTIDLSILGEMGDEEVAEFPYTPLPHSLTETPNISEFTEDLKLQGVTAMIGFLEDSEGVSREELCDPQLPITRITSVAWVSLDGAQKNMTAEVARSFLWVAREILGANDTVSESFIDNHPLSSIPVEPITSAHVERTRVQANLLETHRAVEVATIHLSEDIRPTEANKNRAGAEFRSLNRALEILFPWPKTDEMIGVTEDQTTRRQMVEPFVFQNQLPKKKRLAGYELRRQKIWENMSIEAKKMLITDMPVSVKVLPALLKRGAHQIFWTQCGDLILLWIQAYMWADTGFLPRLDSIKQCISTGNNCLKRSNPVEEDNV